MKHNLPCLLTFLLLLKVWAVQAQHECSGIPSSSLSAVVVPDTHLAGSKSMYRLKIGLTGEDLPSGTVVKIWFVKGLEVLQYADSSMQNYISAFSSKSGIPVTVESIEKNNTEEFYLWDKDNEKSKVITLKTGGDLFAGDTIFLQAGTISPGGKMKISNNSFSDNFKIAYDTDNNGVFTEIIARPVLNFLPDTIMRYITATVGSVSHPGNSELLRIRVFDQYYNQITNYEGDFFISCTADGAVFPVLVHMENSDSGKLDIPVLAQEENVFRFHVTSADTSVFSVYSNPLYVTTAPFKNIYWGDMHNHSHYSRDGNGAQSADYAKYAMCLDFYSEADHAEMQVGSTIAGINCEEMEEILSNANSLNEDGKFTCFTGYEISKNTNYGGHHNYIFNTAGTDTIPVFFTEENIEEILADAAKIPGLQMLCMPHHTGKQFDATDPETNCANHFGGSNINTKYRRLAEIYSGHGSSEYYDPDGVLSYENQTGSDIPPLSVNGASYLQDAWALYEKFSVVASTDDHKGKPGLPGKGATAVFADTLTRDDIFYNLYNKNTYATTGNRIIMDITVNDSLMGRDIVLDENAYPKFDMHIYGTDTIEYIEMLKWDFLDPVFVNGHPQYKVIQTWYPGNWNYNEIFTDNTYTGCSMYYFRLKQKKDQHAFGLESIDAAYAWSSPFWIAEKNANCPVVFSDAPGNINDNDFIVYPNPASSACTVSGNTQINAIHIYDLNGKCIRKENADNFFSFTLQLNELASGVYILHIFSGSNVVNKKIIKS